MAKELKFFTYPFPAFKPPHRRSHVIVHPNRFKWLVINKEGLEIAKCLAEGDSPEQISENLTTKYCISSDAALRDINYVEEELERNLFLAKNDNLLQPRLPRLKSLFIHLTTSCNLSCPHCYTAPGSLKSALFLSYDAVIKMIDQLVNKGGSSLTLSGGEPLIHPEIKQILAYAVRKLEVRLLTNGTLIDKEWAKFLADLDVSVQLSLDGSSSSIHDSIRGEGSFKKILDALDYLQQAGLGKKINFSTTITSQNIDDLPAIIALAEELEVPLVRFLPLRKKGNAQEAWQEIGSGLDVADYKRFFDFIFGMNQRRASSIELSCGLSGFLLTHEDQGSDDDTWCPIGKMLVVGADGNVYPCVLMMTEEFRMGNIFSESLGQIISKKEMSSLCNTLSKRKDTIEDCKPCSWRSLCQGGCMGQALEHKGTIWDRDDFCEYRKEAYAEAFDKILDKTDIDN